MSMIDLVLVKRDVCGRTERIRSEELREQKYNEEIWYRS